MMEPTTVVMWIMLSLLWLAVGGMIGWVVRDARAVENLRAHNERLVELLLGRASNVIEQMHRARVRDTESESPEARAQARISEAAIDGLSRYIASESGVSLEKARDEATRMMASLDPLADATPDDIKGQKGLW